MGWQPTYQVEGHAYAKYILATKPAAKVAVLYQDDDFGKDFLKGMKDGLGEANAGMLSSPPPATRSPTRPSICRSSALRKRRGCLFMTGIPKFNAMAMRKVYDIGWRSDVLHFLHRLLGRHRHHSGRAGEMRRRDDIAYLKDPTDKQWANDAGFLGWLGFMKKFYPEGDLTDINNAYGYCDRTDPGGRAEAGR